MRGEAWNETQRLAVLPCAAHKNDNDDNACGARSVYRDIYYAVSDFPFFFLSLLFFNQIRIS